METTHHAHSHPWTQRREQRCVGSEALPDELLRYVLVCALLLFLVRPIGVIVALVWGFRIARRLRRGELEGGSRARRRRRHGRRPEEPAPRRASGPERLAREMGDDPRSDGSLDWARTALDELAAHERGAPSDARSRDSSDAPVRVSDVVEDVVDAFEPRVERSGISFRLEVDTEGELLGDARRVRAVLLDLVGESVRALEGGARGPACIRVQMGENLAGSQVWVRIRDDRLDAAPGARGVYGSRPVPGIPGATLETHASRERGVERILTFEKSPARARGGEAS